MIAHASKPALGRQKAADLHESKTSPFYIMSFRSTRITVRPFLKNKEMKTIWGSLGH